MVQRIPAVIGVADNCREGNPLMNSGNLTHAVAARRILGEFTEFPTSTEWDDATVERLRENHSHVVIVFANAIRLGGISADAAHRHSIITKNLKKVDLPVVVFGLGSQAQVKPSPGEKLITAPETIEMIRLLGERCQSIAVRGAFTAEVLDYFGVKNAEVLGCQSCFWHLTPEFPFALQRPEEAPEKPIAFSYTGPLKEWELLKFAVDNKLHMVGQQHYLEYLITKGADTTNAYVGRAKGLATLYERGNIKEKEYESYIRNYFHMFYELDPWFEFIKNFRFVFGSRFHGGMTGLLAGVPSVWVRHDTRTEELCDHLMLPSVSLEQARKFTHIEQYFEVADYSGFYVAYPDNYRKLYDYLAKAGVPNQMQPPLLPSAEPKYAEPLRASSPDILTEIKSMASAMQALSEQLNALPKRLSESASVSRSAVNFELEKSRMKRAAAYDAVALPTSRPDERAIGDAIQLHGNTAADRYPNIFKAVADIYAHEVHESGARVLSFGCSTGEEATTLAERYFTGKKDRILGVDIVDSFIKDAQISNPDPKRIEFLTSSDQVLKKGGPFDVIFAMSVLCRWPESMDLEDISSLMSFKQFERIVQNLDSHLAVGGLLVIYNASFCMDDVSFADRYEVEPIASVVGSGFVKKFGKDNKSLGAEFQYPHVVFRKKA